MLLREDGGNKTANPICRAGSSTIVISPENNLIVPCYHLGSEQFKIENNLYDLYYSDKVQQIVQQQGRYPACEGCVINCYMQPSFAVEITKYWFAALPSTLKYSWHKNMWKKYLAGW